VGSRSLGTLWVIEDTSSYYERGLSRSEHGSAAHIALRLYRIRHRRAELQLELTYRPHSDRGREFKGTLGVELLRRAKVRTGIVVASQRVLRGTSLLRGLTELNLDFVVALPLTIEPKGQPRVAGHAELLDRLSQAKWTDSRLKAPDSAAKYAVADLGHVTYKGISGLRCIALSTGGITDFKRGLIIGVSSLPKKVSVSRIAALLGWTRWVRTVSRRSQKAETAELELTSSIEPATDPTSAARQILDLSSRSNHMLGGRQDREVALRLGTDLFANAMELKRRLGGDHRRLNVVELFAGAGGMSLGFLTAGGEGRGYSVRFSGEIHPVYANTLRVNHEFLRANGCVADDDLPEDIPAVDLRAPTVMDRVQCVAAVSKGIDIVIGGPPCQGFSAANRNSWSAGNPNNKLVETYLDYVVRLRPRVFMMENVQGILWTKRNDGFGKISVAEHVATRLAAAGYRIFPKLIDAAWYGVPQHRNRFFLLGIHSDLGYAQDEFGEWGPFPRPTHGPGTDRAFVTVSEAIRDLPPIENGAMDQALPYGYHSEENGFLGAMRQWAPQDVVYDHVTSRHSEYVIERYRKIPVGGNWSDITDMMTNYAAVQRTHSNIYRRLRWDEPSITIGQYRKAMLVHPEQDRGLSLREASRLQSFPDWFRFAGSDRSIDGGLTNKQQQLGNAVCPLVSRAIAEFLLDL
jgi:DNA-cytosine methyltransferase